MSIVYLAMDNRLNKQWAVKEIKNDGSKSTATLLKGLEREANILKDVDHPVLPRIVDIINENGTIYVVMDFVEGRPLSDVLKAEGAQPQEKVIEWGRALASALDYLHSMNPPIIYRDMKPSNVMLKPDGSVKLIDFGTAKEYIVENNADTTALEQEAMRHRSSSVMRRDMESTTRMQEQIFTIWEQRSITLLPARIHVSLLTR